MARDAKSRSQVRIYETPVRTESGGELAGIVRTRGEWETRTGAGLEAAAATCRDLGITPARRP